VPAIMRRTAPSWCGVGTPARQVGTWMSCGSSTWTHTSGGSHTPQVRDEEKVLLVLDCIAMLYRNQSFVAGPAWWANWPELRVPNNVL
jgi:hypothetical protein